MPARSHRKPAPDICLGEAETCGAAEDIEVIGGWPGLLTVGGWPGFPAAWRVAQDRTARLLIVPPAPSATASTDPARPPPRPCLPTKWLCLAATCLIAVAYLASTRYCFGATYGSGKVFDRYCLVGGGHAEYLCSTCPEDPEPPGVNWQCYRWSGSEFAWMPRWRFAPKTDNVIVPLWIPLLLTAIPTAIL